MEDRTETFADRSLFYRLIAALLWYENMPGDLNGIAGDRFHENMSDHFKRQLPKIPETDDSDGFRFYIETVSATTDTIIVEIGSADTGETSHTITYR